MHYAKGLAVIVTALAVPAFMFSGVQGPNQAIFSQYIGSAALIAMALSHLIATRAGFVEALFGPLDRSYVLHKWLGIGALAAVLLHEQIDAEIKALGRPSALNDLGESLGEQSLNGLMILIAITLLTFIPYRYWYWTHRAMGACFVLGAAHYAMILKPFSNFDPLGLYVLAFCAIGVLCYAYTLIPRNWRRGRMYRVAGLARTGNALEISLAPEDKPIRHMAGQFAFFTVEEPGLAETHPFTISSAPRADGSLRISVAALGDYTDRLSTRLREGMAVRVQGPYGRFAPSRSNRQQIWIAGGIGITPFMAWLDGLPKEGPQVDLIYTFRGEVSAPHLQKIKRLSEIHPRVTLHLVDTVKSPRLDAKYVRDLIGTRAVSVSFCGPKRLRQELRGIVPARHFHFEEFEIRTGLPFTDGPRARISEMFRRPARG